MIEKRESDLEVHSERMRRYEHKLQQGKFQLNGRGKRSYWGQPNFEKGAQSGSGVSDLEMFGIRLAKALSRAKLVLL